MENLCEKCEMTGEYLDIGNCPTCGADHLMMNNATSIAICGQCGESFGVPKARICLCAEDVFSRKYTVSLLEKPEKAQILQAAKITGRSAVELFAASTDRGMEISELSMFQAYQFMEIFIASGKPCMCRPPLKDYKNLKKCWGNDLK